MNSLEDDIKRTPHKGIIIDLDALLDTRILTLFNLNKEVAQEVLEKDTYLNRTTDNFGFINNEVFNHFYEKRDLNTIREPVPTKILDIALEFIIKARAEDIKNGGEGIYSIYLNTYPYDLSDIQKEQMCLAILARASHELNVTTQFMSKKDYTVKFLSEKIDAVFSYDSIEIINELFNNKNLHNNSIPDVTFFSPRIALGQVKLEDMENYTLALQPFVNLVYLDTKYFSLI